MTTNAVFDRSMIEFFIAISVFLFRFEVKLCFVTGLPDSNPSRTPAVARSAGLSSIFGEPVGGKSRVSPLFR